MPEYPHHLNSRDERMSEHCYALEAHARDLTARLEAAHALLAANPEAHHWCETHLRHYPSGGDCPKCCEERGAEVERERLTNRALGWVVTAGFHERRDGGLCDAQESLRAALEPKP